MASRFFPYFLNRRFGVNIEGISRSGRALLRGRAAALTEFQPELKPGSHRSEVPELNSELRQSRRNSKKKFLDDRKKICDPTEISVFSARRRLAF